MSTGATSILRVDDAVTAYRVAYDGRDVGEIRPRAFGTAELHVPDGRFLLRRDDTADAVARGARWAAVIAGGLRFNARWSLRAGDAVLATGARRFRLGLRADGVEFDLSRTGDVMAARMLDGITRGIVLTRGAARIAHIEQARGGRQFGAQAFPADRIRCVFALYVLHMHFGRHPDHAA